LRRRFINIAVKVKKADQKFGRTFGKRF